MAVEFGRLSRVLLAGIVFVCTTSFQHKVTVPPRFTVTPLPALHEADFINDDGEIGGFFSSDSGALRVVVLKNGKQERVLPPCRPNYEINLVYSGINDAGVISANCHEHPGMPSETIRACLWRRDGKCLEPGALGGKYSRSFGINRSGHVVGQAEIGKTRLEDSWNGPRTVPVEHAFLWDGKRIKDLDKANPGSSAALAINDNGDIIVARYSPGTDGRGDTQRLFLRSNGQVEEMYGVSDRDDYVRRINRRKQVLILNPRYGTSIWEDGKTTVLRGISNANGHDLNDTGEVVGSANSRNRRNEWWMPRPTAFLWHDGTMYDLNDLIPKDSGLILSHAMAINNKSQIVGIAQRKKDGAGTAFLLTPTTVKKGVPRL